MKLTIKHISVALLVLAVVLAAFIPAMLFINNSSEVALASDQVTVDDSQVLLDAAAGTEETEQAEVKEADNSKGTKAIAAAIVVGIAAAAGAIAMGFAISKSVDGIARQPEADGKIRTSLMLGLVFIETAIIYALIVAILIIFVM